MQLNTPFSVVALLIKNDVTSPEKIAVSGSCQISMRSDDREKVSCGVVLELIFKVMSTVVWTLKTFNFAI